MNQENGKKDNNKHQELEKDKYELYEDSQNNYGVNEKGNNLINAMEEIEEEKQKKTNLKESSSSGSKETCENSSQKKQNINLIIDNAKDINESKYKYFII